MPASCGWAWAATAPTASTSTAVMPIIRCTRLIGIPPWGLVAFFDGTTHRFVYRPPARIPGDSSSAPTPGRHPPGGDDGVRPERRRAQRASLYIGRLGICRNRSAAPDRREWQLPADGPTCSWSLDRPRRAASRARLRQAGGRRDADRPRGGVTPASAG